MTQTHRIKSSHSYNLTRGGFGYRMTKKYHK
uniref:Uncharacterized protein n=1 Tax=Arundo donax TaxID=35708 RepID=A0A0A8YPZ6_ARUDO